MKEILKNITSLPAVHGAFVCSPDGALLARSLPEVFEESMLSQVGEVTGRTIAGLETTGTVRELDLAYSDIRLLVKNLGEGQLFVLCQPETNVAFLNLTANVAAQQLKKALEEGTLGKPPEKTKKDRLDELVAAELGDHAHKAQEILAAAGDSRTSLLKAAQEIERMTRLFISKKKATELSILLQSIIAE